MRILLSILICTSALTGLAQERIDTVYRGDTIQFIFYKDGKKHYDFLRKDGFFIGNSYWYHTDSTYGYKYYPRMNRLFSPRYFEERFLDSQLRQRGHQMMISKKLHGFVESYYSDGTPKCLCNYYKGRRDGHSAIHYHNGQLETRGYYYFDKPVGQHYYYHPNGQLWIRMRFSDNGKLINFSSNHDSSGNVRSAGTINRLTNTGYLFLYDYDDSLLAKEYYFRGRKLFDYTVRRKKKKFPSK